MTTQGSAPLNPMLFKSQLQSFFLSSLSLRSQFQILFQTLNMNKAVILSRRSTLPCYPDVLRKDDVLGEIFYTKFLLAQENTRGSFCLEMEEFCFLELIHHSCTILGVFSFSGFIHSHYLNTCTTISEHQDSQKPKWFLLFFISIIMLQKY